MRLLPGRFQSPKSSPPHVGSTPLTRKALYNLAKEARTTAEILARHDQHRVVLKQCNEFNTWLSKVKQYDQMAIRLELLKPARPVARWQLMSVGGVIGIFMLLLLPPRVGSIPGSVLLYGYIFALIGFFFVPESYYGTTIELLEGKMLRIVEAMDAILQKEALGFSEAAYFQTKENLAEAKRELRQQIDLAHRRWR